MGRRLIIAVLFAGRGRTEGRSQHGPRARDAVRPGSRWPMRNIASAGGASEVLPPP
jgi:hypothetical protein